ncbi:hypothetical protein GUJ93_ZPchr0001g32420 [Zizania palustris]|uniref:Uncharacterized protein n=1 Tax=Zizania palustris TaxID=103762 RepID=A0A8J5RQ76_ZIZPA|nr:hypothetical protein GUJ93_ZPchr0001g32420 [Zizania palustris]
MYLSPVSLFGEPSHRTDQAQPEPSAPPPAFPSECTVKDEITSRNTGPGGAMASNCVHPARGHVPVVLRLPLCVVLPRLLFVSCERWKKVRALAVVRNAIPWRFRGVMSSSSSLRLRANIQILANGRYN